jgi:hypothetical protein
MNDPREMKDEAVSTFAKVYVGNLIPKANEIHLHQIFAEYGVIESIWVARKVSFLKISCKNTGSDVM